MTNIEVLLSNGVNRLNEFTDMLDDVLTTQFVGPLTIEHLADPSIQQGKDGTACIY
jgi:hypothetical protein